MKTLNRLGLLTLPFIGACAREAIYLRTPAEDSGDASHIDTPHNTHDTGGTTEPTDTDDTEVLETLTTTADECRRNWDTYPEASSPYMDVNFAEGVRINRDILIIPFIADSVPTENYSAKVCGEDCDNHGCFYGAEMQRESERVFRATVDLNSGLDAYGDVCPSPRRSVFGIKVAGLDLSDRDDERWSWLPHSRDDSNTFEMLMLKYK